jgi:hypothetical protein
MWRTSEIPVISGDSPAFNLRFQYVNVAAGIDAECTRTVRSICAAGFHLRTMRIAIQCLDGIAIGAVIEVLRCSSMPSRKAVIQNAQGNVVLCFDLFTRTRKLGMGVVEVPECIDLAFLITSLDCCRPSGRRQRVVLKAMTRRRGTTLREILVLENQAGFDSIQRQLAGKIGLCTPRIRDCGYAFGYKLHNAKSKSEEPRLSCQVPRKSLLELC